VSGGNDFGSFYANQTVAIEANVLALHFPGRGASWWRYIILLSGKFNSMTTDPLALV